MTATPTSVPVARRRSIAAWLLLRVDVRRNTMRWALPILAVLFWFMVYRRSLQNPPMWNVRAMTMQTAGVSIFAPVVAGVAAWTGSREGRHDIGGLMTSTARARWIRQLSAWAATTCWSILAFLGCVIVFYGVTERQAAWGGPLWWPVAVTTASLPMFAAVGFVAGALRPSRFTAPLVAIGAFLGLELTAEFIHGYHSYWQISPLVAGPWNFGSNEGLATFYRYLPDLPMAQVTFLVGLTAALISILGLSAGSGGRWLRPSAAAILVLGLLAAGTAVALVGTGRLAASGMIAIPRLHDAADDRQVPYTPVCSATPIPVCLHPAYAAYLPAVTEALRPILTDLAGLPGAPTRISQVAPNYQQQSGDGFDVRIARTTDRNTPHAYPLLLPNLLPGPPMSVNAVAAAVKANAERDIVVDVFGRSASPALRAVTAAILGTYAKLDDPPTAAAARRFAALSDDVRHAWLVDNLAALRDGTITVAQVP
jgi:hypothetical protein